MHSLLFSVHLEVWTRFQDGGEATVPPNGGKVAKMLQSCGCPVLSCISCTDDCRNFCEGMNIQKLTDDVGLIDLMGGHTAVQEVLYFLADRCEVILHCNVSRSKKEAELLSMFLKFNLQQSYV